MEDEATSQGIQEAPKTKNDMGTYSMLESPDRSFPNPKLREQICQILILWKFVSTANFSL